MINLNCNEKIWHYYPAWVLMGFTLFAAFFMKSAFESWLLIPISLTIVMFLVRRISLKYKRIDIPCSELEFKNAIHKTILERNWKSLEEKADYYRASRPSLLSREGQLITVAYQNGRIYANSICFPRPTTNPFDLISNRKNITALTNNLKQLTTRPKSH